NEQIAPLGERQFLLDGGLVVRDLNRRLKLSVPESEAYTTIAGFLMTAAGHVLKPGEIVEYNGLVFHVERVERRRVLRVRLLLPAETEEPEAAATVGGARSG
ncbi:MAG TPA: transporter associated domain-containing protein, partial [Pyrinomonadaceae bacterium]|nr:transporter associated domain-containing protein [Pyrinomonadaceae bacterium]